jgi:hypothetical protein
MPGGNDEFCPRSAYRKSHSEEPDNNCRLAGACRPFFPVRGITREVRSSVGQVLAILINGHMTEDMCYDYVK